MAHFIISVKNSKGEVLAKTQCDDSAILLYDGAYREGDSLCFCTDEPDIMCILQADDALPPALVMLQKSSCVINVPWGELRTALSPRAYTGDKHLITLRKATKAECGAYRNIALNPFDTHINNGIFPHAAANIETRGEAVFAARNAIDGVLANHGHGAWPYQSWGINRDPKAALTVYFGREALVQEVALTLRADYPHDSHWQQATLTFSDGSSETLLLLPSDKPQHFAITPRKAGWVRLAQLVKAADESPFPALTQLEVFGVM